MAVAVAIQSAIVQDPSQGIDKTQNKLKVRGTFTLSGNYGGASSHGDTVVFANDLIKSDYPPDYVRVWEDQGAGNAPLGYTFLYNRGTTPANGVLVVLGTSAAGGATTGTTEFTEAGAYSGGTPSLNGAVLQFEASFALFI